MKTPFLFFAPLFFFFSLDGFCGGRSFDPQAPAPQATPQKTIEPGSLPFDPLQGNVHRANLFRNANFDSSGLPAFSKIAWKFQTVAAVRSSPVVVQGTVFFGSGDGFVYAVDAETGKEKWRFDTGAPVNGSAAVQNETVYIASESGFLLALDAKTGAKRWDAPTKFPTLGSPALLYGAAVIGSGSKGGHDEISMSTGPLLAFDAKNGTPIWRGAAGPQGYAAITTDGNFFYTASNGSAYYSFLVSDGKLAQKLRGDHQGRQWTSCAIRDNTLFVPVNIRGAIAAFDISSTPAKPLWFNTTLPRNKEMEMNGGGLFGYEILSDIAIGESFVLAGCNDGKLYAFDRWTGAVAWTFPTGGKIQSGPSIAGKLAYFGSQDGKLYAIDATSGTLAWHCDLGNRIFSSPWPGNGSLFVGCDDGFVYCLQ